MDAQDWIERCSARLHRQWPNIHATDLEETARDLYQDERWRSMLPERAAETWLRPGALAG